MYGAVRVGEPVRYEGTCAVRSEAELAYLVKESEILTSQPGREFFAVLSDSILRYRVSLIDMGFEVIRVGADQVGERILVTPEELAASTLGCAMSDGHLFCHAVL